MGQISAEIYAHPGSVLSGNQQREAKRHGIRVNCLTPSIVGDTPLYGKLKADPFASRLFVKAEDMADLGIVTAADLAEAVVFLASPSAARMTGQTISITGGISAI